MERRSVIRIGKLVPTRVLGVLRRVEVVSYRDLCEALRREQTHEKK